MDFSQIKLVVSDMDGTLLNSKGNVSSQFFSLFKKLQEKNIHFCAASGRQHNSIVSKLNTIKNQIYVIAENGGVVKKGETTLLSQFLDAQKVQEIIPILRIYGDVDILTSGSQSQINLGFPVKYDFKGISLFYGSNGNFVNSIKKALKRCECLIFKPFLNLFIITYI